MVNNIKRVSVIGSGVMGAQIAGHLANCGIDVLLLDVKTEYVMESFNRLQKSKPPALYSDSVLKRITPGNIETDFAGVFETDWIIEVVPEKMEIKESIYKKIEKGLKPNIIISSNTSGLSLKILNEGRSEEFKKSFMITHFFNPVRFMKLVELITSEETDSEKSEAIVAFLVNVLGKGIVKAKDTPSFIANRVGVFSAINAINKTFKNGWPIELVDAVMGPPATFPKSAIFRTADLVGLDTLVNVAKNTFELCPNDKFRDFIVPSDELIKLIERGALGQKTGAGFYKKDGKEILVYDQSLGDYRPRNKVRAESLKMVKRIKDPAQRLRTLFKLNDDAAKIAKELVTDLMEYSSYVAPEIADNANQIDQAMKWGYHWELGPFEMWKALEKEFSASPSLAHTEEVEDPERLKIKTLKTKDSVVRSNGSASLIDLGDGALCCQFHSKMNAIDPDIISMMNEGIDLAESGKYQGLLVANDGSNFSVGANLFMIAMSAASGTFSLLEEIINNFQNLTTRIKYSIRPVVMVPFGMALGGGCEISMAATNVVAAAETYMGLVELGVGLIPAGGGCKNMLFNTEERMRKKNIGKNDIWFAAKDGGPFPKVAHSFETIALAKVSKSAANAVELGYLRKNTKVVIDRERLLFEAKKELLEVASDYSPPEESPEISVPGNGGKMALINNVKSMKLRGLITDYDAVLAEALSHILCGGNVPTNHMVSEQDILDLEREVFLSLSGRKETLARIQHMLATGKPLRN